MTKGEIPAAVKKAVDYEDCDSTTFTFGESVRQRETKRGKPPVVRKTTPRRRKKRGPAYRMERKGKGQRAKTEERASTRF